MDLAAPRKRAEAKAARRVAPLHVAEVAPQDRACYVALLEAAAGAELAAVMEDPTRDDAAIEAAARAWMEADAWDVTRHVEPGRAERFRRLSALAVDQHFRPRTLSRRPGPGDRTR